MKREEIEKIRETGLIFDIETSSVWPHNNEPIDIRTYFEDYVKYAKVKFIGFYSYKYNQYKGYMVQGNEDLIRKIIEDHDILIGFNNVSFDTPILENNDLIPSKKTYIRQVDCHHVLSKDKYGKDSMSFKGKGYDMGYSPESQTLKAWAEAMGLPVTKGDIDYNIFLKDKWTPEELEDIHKYLESDVLITKMFFDEIWEFWMPFTKFISDENIKNLSWIKSSMASITYKNACHILQVDEDYGEPKDYQESMGGRAIEPVADEQWNCIYLDEASKYPNIFCEFMLYNEVDVTGMSEKERTKFWHGNEKFNVRGYYDISYQNPLAADTQQKLLMRAEIKNIIKRYNFGERDIEMSDELVEMTDGIKIDDHTISYFKRLEQALKLLNNSKYGIYRSPVFANVFSPNAGYDCCSVGQQIHEYVEEFFNEKGYPARGGFTDSWFLKLKDGEPMDKNTREQFKRWCVEIMDELKKWMPYPSPLHSIEVECFMDYLMYHYNKKEKRFSKNNYAFISDGKIKVVGFPIIKSNSTKASKKILENHIKPRMLKETRGKFEPEWMKGILASSITLPDLAQTYNCKPSEAYKPRLLKDGTEVPSSNIYAQISREYTGGLGGSVLILKNKIVGNIGPAAKKIAKGKKPNKSDWFYATLEMCEDAGATIDHIDLTKVKNELAPFVKGGEL